MSQKERDQILVLLSKSGVPFEHLVHEPAFTSEQASRVRGVSLNQGVKAMLLESNHNNFYLFCLPADQKIDLAKAAEIVQELRLFLAQPAEVLRLTGCEIGSVSPFSGVLSGIQSFFDRGVLENETVEFNIGLHTDSVRMKSRGLVDLVKPVLHAFAIAK